MANLIIRDVIMLVIIDELHSQFPLIIIQPCAFNQWRVDLTIQKSAYPIIHIFLNNDDVYIYKTANSKSSSECQYSDPNILNFIISEIRSEIAIRS